MRISISLMAFNLISFVRKYSEEALIAVAT
jgi:hypothetical protein